MPRSSGFVLFACIFLLAGTSAAQDLPSGRGGDIVKHAVKAYMMEEEGVRPRFISGNIYRSANTMFLGVAGACVEPGATFVFHGPSWGSRRMSDADAKNWSVYIAKYYPPKLAEWFMETGRFGTYRMNGATVIKLGAKAC